MSSVTIDRANGELRNDVSFFRAFDSRPDDIRWRVKEGDAIEPGDEIGRFVWPDEAERAAIVAPPECRGTVLAVNRGVICRFLGRSPSQVLLRIALAKDVADELDPRLADAARHAGVHEAIEEAARRRREADELYDEAEREAKAERRDDGEEEP